MKYLNDPFFKGNSYLLYRLHERVICQFNLNIDVINYVRLDTMHLSNSIRNVLISKQYLSEGFRN